MSHFVDFDLSENAMAAMDRLVSAKLRHAADCHETYFEAGGEEYRLLMEKIPSSVSAPKRVEQTSKQLEAEEGL